MADIQSATAEIRRGKKRKIEEEEETTGQNIKWPALFLRAAIIICCCFRQGEYAIVVVCLSVYLSVTNFAQKLPKVFA